MAKPFRVWACGDAHVGTDKANGRDSLAESIRGVEQGGDQGGPGFEWDIAVNVGDYSGGQGVPEDEEGEEVVRQFGALTKHPREAMYDICGNHDRSGLDEAQAWWFRKWIDPTGEHQKHSQVNSSRRPYPIEGTWERYKFQVGNIVFLMMSDINEPSQKLGRGPLGGNPGGVVSGETFDWWREQVAAHADDIVITAHHYVLKNTTVASGDWEGFRKKENGEWKSYYHGYKQQGAPRGASYLYWTDGVENAQKFARHLESNPGGVDLWMGGHTHTFPDDCHGGKSHLEKAWGGTTFINVAALTKYHVSNSTVPMSRLLTFTPGSDELRVQCYLHTADFAPQGWHEPSERMVKLSRPFEI